MSAEVGLLREAATQVRERAEAATTDDERRPYGNRTVDPVPESKWGALVDNYLGGAIGTHCASWTPAAAFAVADLLDKAVDGYTTEWDEVACADDCPEVCAGHGQAEFHVACDSVVGECPCLAPFVVVARAFLRREAGESS